MGGLLAKDMSIVDEGNGQLAVKLPHLNLDTLPGRVTSYDRAVLNRIVKIDLSHNRFKNIDFIRHFPNLEDLYMDSNRLTHLTVFPPHPKLKGLSLNRNLIGADGKGGTMCVERIANAYPHLRFLSLLHNPGCPSYFIGSSLAESEVFRNFCICRLPSLGILDSTPVTDEEREEAEDELGASFATGKKVASKGREDREYAASTASVRREKPAKAQRAESTPVIKREKAEPKAAKEKEVKEAKASRRAAAEPEPAAPAEVCGGKTQYFCRRCAATLYLDAAVRDTAACPKCASRDIAEPTASAPPPVPAVPVGAPVGVPGAPPAVPGVPPAAGGPPPVPPPRPA